MMTLSGLASFLCPSFCLYARFSFMFTYLTTLDEVGQCVRVWFDYLEAGGCVF